MNLQLAFRSADGDRSSVGLFYGMSLSFIDNRIWQIKEKEIEVIQDISAMGQTVKRLARGGKDVALVPTMGFLHEGHLALMREAGRHADVVITSIFVNPTQFGPSEDFAAYPRDLNHDMPLADSAGVDILFTPSAAAMYGNDHETFVDLHRLPNHLCGTSRPGHFRGVVTVVSKLFNIVKPQVAVFGKKDYQQFVIIRRLVKDLNYDVRIVGAPIVRDTDGVAMSSRNSYLSSQERESARSLFRGLQEAQQLVWNGSRDANELADHVSSLIHAHPHTKIDYVALCHPETLEAVSQVNEETLMALAVYIGSTRLIDNTVLTLHPPSTQ